MEEKKQKLCTVLTRARIDVVCAPENISQEDVKSFMQTCNCSVHILGNEDFYSVESPAYSSSMGVQFRVAQELRSKDFKVFLWNPNGEDDISYINILRRDIVENTIYSNKLSPIYFAEELRSMVSSKSSLQIAPENKDVFFIYNSLDEETALNAAGMAEDVLSMLPLAVSMDSNIDYAEYIKKQLPSCKICVVYFDYAGDWAVSFTRQIWKDNGGDSGKTPILLIGNSSHADTDLFKILKNVVKTSVCELSLVPLEIKVFYDKVVEK
jgi:hypothetical protein